MTGGFQRGLDNSDARLSWMRDWLQRTHVLKSRDVKLVICMTISETLAPPDD